MICNSFLPWAPACEAELEEQVWHVKKNKTDDTSHEYLSSFLQLYSSLSTRRAKAARKNKQSISHFLICPLCIVKFDLRATV